MLSLFFFLPLNANSLSFRSIVMGANFTRSLCLLLVTLQQIVRQSTSLYQLKICRFAVGSRMRVIISLTLFFKLLPLLHLSCIRENLFKPSLTSGDLKQNEVANNLSYTGILYVVFNLVALYNRVSFATFWLGPETKCQ